jgi:hypothetical protein
LSLFGEDEKVAPYIAKAKEFLKTAQKDNGSWGDDPSSTAWAIGGIYTLGEKAGDWEKKYSDPVAYLGTLQDADGGVKDQEIKNKIWKTAYVLAALSGKTWDQAMQNFEKKEAVVAPKIASAPKKTAPKPKAGIHAPKPAAISPQPTISEPEVPANDAPTVEVSPETKTPQTDESWFAKFLGIFGWN